MLKLSLSTSGRLADLVREAEAEAPKTVYRRASRDLLPPLERALDRILRHEPAARNESSPPFIWSTNPIKQRRAQRWFFAHYPDGYTRTHELVKAWKASIEFEDGVVTVSVENPDDGASWVYGSDTYGQVPGHTVTGWIPIADTITNITAEAEDGLEELWGNTLAELFK